MKAYTDLEQSKKLAKILPLESADMEYLLEHWIDEKTGRHKEEYYEIPVVKVDDDCPLQPITLPCWSITALLDVVSEEVSLNSFKDGNWNVMVQQNGKMIYGDADNPVDAVFEMIQLLHEQKLL